MVGRTIAVKASGGAMGVRSADVVAVAVSRFARMFAVMRAACGAAYGKAANRCERDHDGLALRGQAGLMVGESG
jgi:hypothetical protein